MHISTSLPQFRQHSYFFTPYSSPIFSLKTQRCLPDLKSYPRRMLYSDPISGPIFLRTGFGNKLCLRAEVKAHAHLAAFGPGSVMQSSNNKMVTKIHQQGLQKPLKIRLLSTQMAELGWGRTGCSIHWSFLAHGCGHHDRSQQRKVSITASSSRGVAQRWRQICRAREALQSSVVITQRGKASFTTA